MSAPALTAAVRSNLNSLQSTADLLGRTQERLATGLKVNSAVDNPGAFFAAQTLNGKADDLNVLLEQQGQDIQTIKAADEGLKSISGLLNTAKGILNNAASSADVAERESYRLEYQEVLDQIETIAADSGYQGVNLLSSAVAGGETLTSKFDAEGDSTLDVAGVDFDDTTVAAGGGTNGLGIGADTAANSFTVDAAGDTAIDAQITAVNTALSTVRSTASSFGTSLSIIETRQSFTESLVETFEEGAGKLTLADTNEESANLLALQTRQSLGVTALSLSAQSEQSVLRLF